MDIFEIVMMTIQITNVLSKKYASASDESIENLLYFKDCQLKQVTQNDQNKPQETTTTTTVKPIAALRGAQQLPPQRQPDCPFPKMCCALSCGEDCGGSRSFMSRQMDSQMPNLQPIEPIEPPLPIQPQIKQRRRKNKVKFPPSMQLPMPTRRNFGSTKEKIKGLISQDQDIRKILKDLVKVTIQKVDLLGMMTTEKPVSPTEAEAWNNSEEDDYYE